MHYISRHYSSAVKLKIGCYMHSCYMYNLIASEWSWQNNCSNCTANGVILSSLPCRGIARNSNCDAPVSLLVDYSSRRSISSQLVRYGSGCTCFCRRKLGLRVSFVFRASSGMCDSARELCPAWVLGPTMHCCHWW